jgi:hypothetical protein
VRLVLANAGTGLKGLQGGGADAGAVLFVPHTCHLPKPSRSLRAAASICVSNSPASTARLINSSVGTKSRSKSAVWSAPMKKS